MTKRRLSRRESLELWLVPISKLFGHALVLVGAVGFIASGFRSADQTIIGAGVLLIGGGAGAEFIATLRRPPVETPPPVVEEARP